MEQAESEQNFDSLPMETLGAEPMHIEGIEHAVTSPQDNVVRYCSRPYSPATEYDETIYSKRQKVHNIFQILVQPCFFLMKFNIADS